MSLLLDTHTVLWFYRDDERLPASTRQLILAAGTKAYVSVASLWEIAIKLSLKKLSLRGEFEELFPASIEQSGFSLLPVSVPHLAAITRLPHHHRDPFDRLLIAQAMVEKLTLVTCDERLRAYDADIIWG